MTVERPTRWGVRASAIYDDSHAAEYRDHDDRIRTGRTITALAGSLRAICGRFDHPIDVLELGCGTGRYFHTLHNVRRLVGIDVSRAMLERARTPSGDVALRPEQITLIEGDFLQHDFADGEFEFVYSIGVLAEQTPFDDVLAGRVRRWLRPGGRFAFTAVSLRSWSLRRTFKRHAAEWTLDARLTPPPVRRMLRQRLLDGGLYADEAYLEHVLTDADLRVESIEPFDSDAHRHFWAVAVRP
jgi:SAM-dependent methyltransferase